MIIVSLNKLNRLWKNGILPKLNEKVSNAKVLSNVEEIEANTDASNIAGALALKEINNDLTALTDSGAIKGLDAREDGVYITYIPSTGADTVTKKLGSTIVDLGTGTSFNVSSYSNFRNFTADNFIIEAINDSGGSTTSHANNYSGIASGTVAAGYALAKNYNASSGILTAYGSLTCSYNRDGGASAGTYPSFAKKCNVRAYLKI